MEHVITVSGLETRFGDFYVHNGVNLEVCRGEIFAIVGGSGTGKSTLLREIIMLETPVAGSIQIFDQDIIGLDDSSADRLRRRFGVMFQKGALFGSLTVQENVAVPLREHTRLSDKLIMELAMLKIALVGLPMKAAAMYPQQLSGGMIKRAAVARALALDPEILFLDEPSAGLDPNGANELDELILQIRESLGLTVVIVTHDLDSLWRITDRVAFLGEKRVLEIDTMKALSNSSHPLIQAYFHGPRGRAAEEHAWVQK